MAVMLRDEEKQEKDRLARTTADVLLREDKLCDLYELGLRILSTPASRKHITWTDVSHASICSTCNTCGRLCGETLCPALPC